MARIVIAFTGLLVVLSALLAGRALAGGWAVVKLDSVPTAVEAGKEITIGFTVLQHGTSPMPNLGPYIKATHVSTGDQIRVDAVDQGEPGHYVAVLVFPKAGAWNWVVNAYTGDHVMPSLEVVPVIAAPAQQPSVSISSVSTERLVAQETFPAASNATGRRAALGLGSAGLLLLASAGMVALRGVRTRITKRGL